MKIVAKIILSSSQFQGWADQLEHVESTTFESLNWSPISPAFSLQIRKLQYTLRRHYGWCYAVSLVSMKYASEAELLADWEDVLIHSTSIEFEDVILINRTTPIDSPENGHDWFSNLIFPKVYLIPLSARRWLGGKRVWMPKIQGNLVKLQRWTSLWQIERVWFIESCNSGYCKCLLCKYTYRMMCIIIICNYAICDVFLSWVWVDSW